MKESMKCFWLIVPVPMEGESRFLFQDKLVCNFFLDLNPKSRLNDYFYSVLRLGYSIATLPPPSAPLPTPSVSSIVPQSSQTSFHVVKRETVQHLKRIIPAWYANGEPMIEGALLGKIGHQVSPFVYHICKSQ